MVEATSGFGAPPGWRGGMLSAVIARLQRDVFPIFWVYWGTGAGMDIDRTGQPTAGGWRFRTPPDWPEPPVGWRPPPGWTPNPQWPPAPPDWQFWEPDTEHPGLSDGGYDAEAFGGRDHPKGTTILILGVLSLVCCGLFTGIPAIIMGKKALEESNKAHYNNVAIIRAGWICGIIGTALSVLGAIIKIILSSLS